MQARGEQASERTPSMHKIAVFIEAGNTLLYREITSLGSSGVEHILGKDEAMGSNPISGLTKLLLPCELSLGYDGWRAAVFFVIFI